MAVTKFANNPIVDVAIPGNVVVPCPISGTQQKRFAANCCPDCENFKGICRLYHSENAAEELQIQSDLQEGKLPWSKVYAIRCECIMEWPCEDIG